MTTCSAPRYSISTGVFHLRCNTTRNDIRLYKKRAAGDTPRTTCGIFVVYISETRYRAYYLSMLFMIVDAIFDELLRLALLSLSAFSRFMQVK